MRRQVIVIFAVLLALGSQPASAQFAISPRGIFGLMTRPLRDMLGHLRGRYRHDHERGRQIGQARSKDHGHSGVKEALAIGTTGRSQSVLNAYDDMLGYAFWPKEYADNLDHYGYDDIATAIVGPLSPPQGTVGLAATNGQKPESSEGGGMVPACRPAGMPITVWMTERFTQRLPDVMKLHSYDNLRTRVNQGAKTIEANCRMVLSSTPVARLATLRQRLWAVHDAGVLVRHSVKTFYDTLSEKEKRAFDDADQAKPKSGNSNAAVPSQRECATHSVGATERMLVRIQQTVHPRAGQRASLKELRKTSAQMETLVLALCARQAPNTPLERLDAANQRLVTMNYAAANVQVALNVFYASLSPHQRARFDSLSH